MARVLVIDDTTFMRIFLKSILVKGGHVVVGEADDGVKTVEQYKVLNPDIVTMDITMPNMNGIDAVKQIMSYDPSAKIVMCSAMGQQEMVMDAIKAGAKDFVVKPFQEDRVLNALSKLI